MYLWIPSLSLAPHPFSVSGPCAVLRSPHDGSVLSAFTVHIRGNGPETFTGKLVRRIAAGQRTGLASGSAAGSDAGAAASSSGGSGVGLLRRFVGSFLQSASGHLQWPGDREWATAAASSSAAVSPAGSSPAGFTPGVLAVPPPLPAGMPTVRVFGPFGRLSLQIGRYANVLLVAGGIGITPIASLHYALINRVPLPGHFDPVDDGDDHTGDGSKSRSCCSGSNGCWRSIAGDDSPHAAPHRSPLRSLMTVWTARGNSLIQEFAPLLLPAPIPATAAAAEAAAAAAASRAAVSGAPATAVNPASAFSPGSGSDYASTISVDGDGHTSGPSPSPSPDGMHPARAPCASLASEARWPDGAPAVGLQIYCSTGGAGGRRGGCDASAGGAGRSRGGGAAPVLAVAGGPGGAGRDAEAGNGRDGEGAAAMPVLGNPLRGSSHAALTPGDASAGASGSASGSTGALSANTSAAEAAAALAPFIRSGRPQLHDILASITRTVLSQRGTPLPAGRGRAAASHTAHADKGANAVAVVVCGPGPLVEDVVAACHRASRDGAVRFDVHTETFEF